MANDSKATTPDRAGSAAGDPDGAREQGAAVEFDVGVEDDRHAAEHAKFDVGAPPVDIDRVEVPWSYGDNRVTALVRDPDSVYLYWEITDDAIDRARQRLGAGGPGAWTCLRVYDTTGHTFDGTNANSYFDISVDRQAREYFLQLGKPTSVHHFEIGLKSAEGFFAAVARSGRAEFPRKSPSQDATVHWMTVTSDQDAPAASPYVSRHAGGEPPIPVRTGPLGGYGDPWRALPGPGPGGGATTRHVTHVEHHHAASWSVSYRQHDVQYHRFELPWAAGEWRTEWRGGFRFARWFGEVHGRQWAGEVESYSWEEGPFPVELLSPERIQIHFSGESRVLTLESGSELTIYGPWFVTIRSFDAAPERRVLGQWMIHWGRATAPVVERWGATLERKWINEFEREEVIVGASESVVLRERGASELWRLGASERMWLGGSEWLKMGASEVLFLGGTETAFAGASALLYRGASETLWLGGTERQFLGATEWLMAGASEWRMRGASETMYLGGTETFALGASEWWAVGASELLLGGSESWLGGSELFLGASEGQKSTEGR